MSASASSSSSSSRESLVPSLSVLQLEATVMQTRVEKLTRENAELRASLMQSSKGSALRREQEAAVVEKDRLLKLVEQLKNEKTHLVETVLALSNEVDAAQRPSEEAGEERLRHLQAEALVRSTRQRLGRDVLQVLEARGFAPDDPIVRDIRAVISQEDAPSSSSSLLLLLPTPLSGKDDGVGKPPLAPYATPTVTMSSATSGVSLEMLDQGSHRLDAESLKANEALYRPHKTPTAANGTLGTGHDAPSSPARGGLLSSTLSSRSRSRNGSVKSRESRRKQTLERDETESVISSVSTHRSGRSHRSATSLMKRPQKSQITAENLKLLNQLNGDDGAPDTAKARATAPTPVTNSRKTEEAAASWWPRLF
jgi:hypothetical protein